MTHIAVDLDDVMMGFVEGLRQSLYIEHGVLLDPDTISSWDLHEVLDPILGQDWWEWLKKRTWLWPNFDAIPGAIGGVEKLRRDGHYMELMTAKPEWAEYVVWLWLGKWKPPFQRVTVAGMNDVKANLTVADILIDDKPANCVEFIRSREDRQALLFYQPHNRTYEVGEDYPRIRRVANWAHILRILGDKEAEIETDRTSGV